MSKTPQNEPSKDKAKLPSLRPADHANIIAENLRRIDAALPLFPLSADGESSSARRDGSTSAPRGPHQPSKLPADDIGGR